MSHEVRGFRLWVLRMFGSRFRAQSGFGFRAQGLGCRAEASGVLARETPGQGVERGARTAKPGCRGFSAMQKAPRRLQPPEKPVSLTEV